MPATNFVTKKNEELIAFIREKMGDKAPEGVEALERPKLIELAKAAEEGEQPETNATGNASPTPETPAETPPAPPPAETPPENAGDTGEGDGEAEEGDKEEYTAEDALEALHIAGFQSKDEVRQYLKGVKKEKEDALKRKEVLEQQAEEMMATQIKLDKREKALDEKGAQVLEDIAKLRKIRDANDELVRHKQALHNLD